MSYFEQVFSKVPFIGSKATSEEDELKRLGKYERIIEQENRILNDNIAYSLNRDSRRAFGFGIEFGRCFDRCSGLAFRSELARSGLEHLIPENIVPVPSQDLLSVNRNAGEEALTDLAGQITLQDLSKPPPKTADQLVLAQVPDQRSVPKSL
ncbi:hypothetical protein BdWA1_002016 [Babesia duncani]|uniref:Uncharacterized protein n=1 Tax=Babesia duncani TaxID=323732 RepID=A0AAD9UPD2_9APIC|nr:hypothetical protein BdWA1_002016 [Babesia duncani]